MRRIEGFKDFRAFRFCLDAHQDPVMMYKKNVLKTTWIGFENSLTDGTSVKFIAYRIIRDSNPN